MGWSCGVVDWTDRPHNDQPVAWFDNCTHLVQGLIVPPHQLERFTTQTHGIELGLLDAG